MAIVYSSGTLVARDFDGIQKCKIGRVDWTAERQREACMGACRCAMMTDARNQAIFQGQRVA